MKTLLTAAAAALMLTAGAASAQTWLVPGVYGPRVPAAVVPQTPAQAAQARVSYGTGYHGRTTRTGGPVGGLPSPQLRKRPGP